MNDVCLLAPYQMGPTLKTLKLKIISNGEAPSFSSAEGGNKVQGLKSAKEI